MKIKTQLEPRRQRTKRNVPRRGCATPLQRSGGLFGSHSQQGNPLGARMSLAVSRHPLTPALGWRRKAPPWVPRSFLHRSKARLSPALPSSSSTRQTATRNTPASCVKERIYSARTQYSIAKKAIVSLKKQNNQNKNHQTFKVTTKASKSLPTLWP